MTLRIPTVHLNGTSKDQLLEQLTTALTALRVAAEAVAAAAPNARDFYVQDGGAISEATAQHRDRLAKLNHVYTELEQIALAVSDQ